MPTNRLAYARLFFVWVLAPLMAFAQSAAQNAVMLKNSSLSSSNITVGQTTTLTAVVANTGSGTAIVLVDLELINSSGQKVDQRFFDNQALSVNSQTNYQMATPPTLPAGTYHFSVGLFCPGWTCQIHWYDTIQNLTVGPSGGTPSDVVLNNTALGEFHLDNCPLLTVLLSNNSNSTQTVLVDTELKDSSGNKVYQEFLDNFAVPATPGNIDASVTNHCNLRLPDGTYFYSVGIFTLHWSSLLHWYNNVKQYTVKTSVAPDVILQNSSETSTVVAPTQSNTLTATMLNTGTEARQVLIDLELINSGNQRVDQKLFDNVSLAPNTPTSFTFTTFAAEAIGTYHFSVGIFTPGSSGPLHWYDSVQVFTAINGPANNSGITVADSNVSKTPIPPGQSTTISAAIVSNNMTISNAIVELTIFDQSNTNRFMEARAGQNLPQDQPVTYSINSPTTLPAGTYRTQLRVFDSTHATTLTTFNDIGTFVVQ